MCVCVCVCVCVRVCERECVCVRAYALHNFKLPRESRKM